MRHVTWRFIRKGKLKLLIDIEVDRIIHEGSGMVEKGEKERRRVKKAKRKTCIHPVQIHRVCSVVHGVLSFVGLLNLTLVSRAWILLARTFPPRRYQLALKKCHHLLCDRGFSSNHSLLAATDTESVVGNPPPIKRKRASDDLSP